MRELKAQHILRINVATENNRIYEWKILDKALEYFRDNGTVPGCIGSPDFRGDRVVINMADFSHLVGKTYVIGDSLYADILILDTPKGRILEELYDKNNIAFRLSGTGNGDKDEFGFFHVGEGYKITTVYAHVIDGIIPTPPKELNSPLGRVLFGEMK